MRWFSRRKVSLVLVTAVAIAVGTQMTPSNGASRVSRPSPGAGADRAAAVDGTGERSVTLVTGDRVLVRPGISGTPELRVEPGPGRRGIGFLRYMSRSHAYVLPMDAARSTLGPLDLSRFDVDRAPDAGSPAPRGGAVTPVPAGAGGTLTVRTVDRSGAPAAEAVVFVVNLDSGEVQAPEIVAGGFTLSLPAARYAVWAGITTPATATERSSLTMAFVPELHLASALTTGIRLDARTGHRVVEKVDRSDAIPYGGIEDFGVRQTVAGETQLITGDVDQEDLFVAPTTTSAPGFGFFHQTLLLEPEVRLTVNRQNLPVAYANTDFCPRFVGDADLTAVDAGRGTPADLSRVDVRGRLALVTLGPDDIGDALARVADVARAGGRAVLLTTTHRPNPGAPFALPVLSPVDGPVVKLLARLRAGTVRVHLHGSRGSAYQYNLMLDRAGAIPADVTFRVHDSDLAKVRTAYAAQAVPDAIASTVMNSPIEPFTVPVKFGLPAVRDEYFSTDAVPGSTDPIDWIMTMRNEGSWDSSKPWGGGEQARRGRYAAGTRHDERFNVGPFGPCVSTSLGPAPAFWIADQLLVLMPVACGGDPPMLDGGSGAFQGELIGTMVVRRDGTEIGRGADPGQGFFPAPMAGGDYQVRVEAHRTAGWTALNTRQDTTWSFPWTDPQATPPMLAVRYTTDLDDHDQAPAGGHTLGVWVDRTATAATVGEPTVDVSYDDGTTWSALTLTPAGERWSAHLDPPAGARYVSLRATAGDTAGSAVTQEVIRAYGLR